MSLESRDGEEEKVKVEFCWQLSDGRYLSGRDSDFIERVLNDLHSFNKKGNRDSILIFPPFKNFHRFLIHNLVEENFKDLKTISVGQSRDRRTVVFHKDREIHNGSTYQNRSTCGGVLAPMGVEHMTECHEVNITTACPGRKKARMLPDVALYQPPALRRASEGTSGGIPLDRNAKSSKQRRPDIAVYVPRALRGSACPQKGALVATTKDSHSERISPCQGTMALESDSGSDATAQGSPSSDRRSAGSHPAYSLGPHPPSSPPTSRTTSSTTPPPNSTPSDLGRVVEGPAAGAEKSPSTIADTAPQGTGGTSPGGDCSPRSMPNDSHGIVGTGGRGSPQSMTGGIQYRGRMSTGRDTTVTAPPTAVVVANSAISKGDVKSGEGSEKRVGHWEDLLDGCGGGELVDEVVAAVGKVSVVEKPRSDYGHYRTDDAALSLSELTHVVELYGFPAEFKTHDLISILSPYGGGPGFEIKWVDDTHALAVFGSSFVAADVLNLRHPMLKTRAMEEASAVSRAKARKICESLRIPYRPRPETCAALAQRLITGALGVHHRQSKAEREEERRLLREAREKRRSAARERDAAWEGTIESTLL